MAEFISIHETSRQLGSGDANGLNSNPSTLPSQFFKFAVVVLSGSQ